MSTTCSAHSDPAQLEARLQRLEADVSILCGVIMHAIPPRMKGREQLANLLSEVFERLVGEPLTTSEVSNGSNSPAGG